MKKKKNKCLSLFKTFFKIGLFTFGGGYAMISLIQKEVIRSLASLKVPSSIKGKSSLPYSLL